MEITRENIKHAMIYVILSNNSYSIDGDCLTISIHPKDWETRLSNLPNLSDKIVTFQIRFYNNYIELFMGYSGLRGARYTFYNNEESSTFF